MKREAISESLSSLYVVTEQVKDDFIKLADGVDIENLTKGDKDPMFITKEVAHEGVSKNKNFYSRKAIKEIYKQILEKKPNGYKGHIDPKDRGTVNPTSRTIWIGAGLKEVDGLLSVYAKGYILPKESKFKDYLRRAVSAGKEIPTSINGISDRVYDRVRKVMNIQNFELESIDWARDFAEGIKSFDKTALLTTEMDSNLDNNTMDYKDITLKGLKENRPDLVEKIEERSNSKKVVTEMAVAMEVEESELLGKLTNLNEELEKTKSRVSEMMVMQGDLVLETTVNQKVSDPALRTAVVMMSKEKVKTIVNEMNGDFDSSKIEELVVSEMKTPEMVALLRTKTDSSFGQDEQPVRKSEGLTKKVAFEG
jgi:hypothetical protein